MKKIKHLSSLNLENLENIDQVRAGQEKKSQGCKVCFCPCPDEGGAGYGLGTIVAAILFPTPG